jgi:dTDP-4-amino-4,6-dideoxygalactose transaminase
MLDGKKLAIFGGPKAVSEPYEEVWPIIDQETKDAVNKYMVNGNLSVKDGTGILDEFENRFANYCSAKFALVQNNGTSTLHAALFAAGVGPGDEVIVPTYTWPSTANVVLSCNATPVFCDIDPKTLCAASADIEKRVTAKTKAICVVHIWGHPADMDAVNAIAKKHKLAVVEDASHAVGSMYKGRKVGTIGDIGCFSLQATKMLIGGEAGIAVTNNPEYYERMLVLSHYGGRIEKDMISKTYTEYAYTGMGPKYRVHPLAAVIANEQLKKVDQYIRLRNENLNYISKGLSDVRGVDPFYTAPDCYRGGYYGYRLTYHHELLNNLPIGRFIEALRAEGVDADPERYKLLHKQMLYQGASHYEKVCGYKWPYSPIREIKYKDSDFPVAVDVVERLISLPTFTHNCRKVLDQYIEAFHKVVESADQLAK